jgi:NAD-dependent SIR2 family protein deacetylase
MFLDTPQIHDATRLLSEAKTVLCVTGAGISTNCGIPDFRSAGGLYAMIAQTYDLPYPEAMFELSYFLQNPEPFFDLSRGICSETVAPSRTHEFLAWPEQIGKEVYIVTQNIDMLHQRAGSTHVIECHGTYRTAHCVACSAPYTLTDIEPEIREGRIPHCRCEGVIKPDVVFYGESLPDAFYGFCEDPPDADVLLVMGSSLQTQPAAGFAVELAEEMPSILVNLEPTSYDDLFMHVVHDDVDVFAEQTWSQMKHALRSG